MKRDDFFRKELATELRLIENLVRNEPSMEKKIYYFSAAYGITGRTFRYSFSKDVLLADFVLTQVYSLLLDGFNQLRAGSEVIQLDSLHVEKICDALKELAYKLEACENIQEPLQEMLATGFSIRGPGLYLTEKGSLII
jgi:hypothetical protein